MLRKVLSGLVVAGAIGFFVGNVIDDEMVYALSGCVAATAGLIMIIQKDREERKKGK